jgi:flagellar protein FlaG
MINHIQSTLSSAEVDAQNSPAGPGPEQAARNRELARAIQKINDHEVFGPGSELRFAVDRETGRGLIRIVDRVTNEVLNQIPPEEVIRMAATLEQLQGHTRFA